MICLFIIYSTSRFVSNILWTHVIIEHFYIVLFMDNTLKINKCWMHYLRCSMWHLLKWMLFVMFMLLDSKCESINFDIWKTYKYFFLELIHFLI